MCDAARLLQLSEPELTQLQHNCLLELLRRYPPTWPTAPVYNITRRIFEATRELHQALEQVDGNRLTCPGLAVSNEEPRRP